MTTKELLLRANGAKAPMAAAGTEVKDRAMLAMAGELLGAQEARQHVERLVQRLLNQTA